MEKEVTKMKKFFAMLLLISLTLTCLVACNGIGNYYSVTVTGTEDTLIDPIKPAYKAGTTVEIKVHPVCDASLHVFVNDEEIPTSHADSDYWSFEFVMPEESITIHLTYDRFYGRDEFSFEELCWGIKSLKDNVTKVSVRTTGTLVKYTLVETRYSSKQVDIDNFKAMLDQKLLKVDRSTVPQATYQNEYSFYHTGRHVGERVETITFDDTFYAWNDFSSWQKFKFADENYTLPTIEDPDLITYRFCDFGYKYNNRSITVRSYDDKSFSIDYAHIKAVEFVPYEGEQIETDSPFYLDSYYGKISLLNATVFEFDGKYYEIVSGAEYWAYNYCHLEDKR